MRAVAIILAVALALVIVAPAAAGNPRMDPCNPAGIHTEQYPC